MMVVLPHCHPSVPELN
jgi:hypothetical protein